MQLSCPSRDRTSGTPSAGIARSCRAARRSSAHASCIACAGSPRGWDSARGRDYTKELRESIENITKVTPMLMPILMGPSSPTSRDIPDPTPHNPPYR